MSEAQIGQVRRLLGDFSDGRPGAIEALVAPEYFSYTPSPGEPSATEVTAEMASGFKTAAPDLRIEIADLADGDDGLMHGEAVISGTWTGDLWGAPPSGKPYTFRLPISVRPVDDRFAFRIDVETPAALAILRELDIVNPPDQMNLPTKHPVVFPDLLVKLLFTRQVADKPCSHLDDIQVTRTDAATCDDCQPDEIWPALRLCLICGHVGCCDTSNNKHAKSHWEQTGHSLVRSIRLSEGWVWCYEDNAVFEKRKLEQIQASLEAA